MHSHNTSLWLLLSCFLSGLLSWICRVGLATDTLERTLMLIKHDCWRLAHLMQHVMTSNVFEPHPSLNVKLTVFAMVSKPLTKARYGNRFIAHFNVSYFLLYLAGTGRELTPRPAGLQLAPLTPTAWSTPPRATTAVMATQIWDPQRWATTVRGTCWEEEDTYPWIVPRDADGPATAAWPTSTGTSPWKRWRALPSVGPRLQASTQASPSLTARAWIQRASHRSAGGERRRPSHHAQQAQPCNIVSYCLLLLMTNAYLQHTLTHWVSFMKHKKSKYVNHSKFSSNLL